MNAYNINTKTQRNTKAEEYMLRTIKNLSFKIDLMVNSKSLPTNNSRRLPNKKYKLRSMATCNF